MSVNDNVIKLPTRSSKPKIFEATRKWLLVKSGPGKGMSVPEFFIKKPNKFLVQFKYHLDNCYIGACMVDEWYDDLDDDEVDGIADADEYDRAVDAQAIEVIKDLCRLDIPAFRKQEPGFMGRDWAKVTVIKRPAGAPIVKLLTTKKCSSGLFHIDGRLESFRGDGCTGWSVPFEEFLRFRSVRRSVLKEVVDCVLSEVAGKQRGNWDRATCEWFFSTRSHFIPERGDE
jgi:hypothetical protein